MKIDKNGSQRILSIFIHFEPFLSFYSNYNQNRFFVKF